MKNKGIIKFRGSMSKGAMHYITYNGDKVSLTMKSSRKVQDINSTNQLSIANNLLSRKFDNMKIEIINDDKYVQDVYNYMLSEKHTHYKNGFEELVVLRYVTV